MTEKQNEVQEKKKYTGADGTKYTEVEWNKPLIEGGPARGEIEEWRAEHGPVYYYPHDSGIYIFRLMTREEYFLYKEELQKINEEMQESEQAADLSLNKAEELFTSMCVLYPSNYSEIVSTEVPAGIPGLLSDLIYERSGFNPTAVAIKL